MTEAVTPERSALAAALRAALIDADTTALSSLLSDTVTWGDCIGPTSVIDHLNAAVSSAVQVTSGELTVADDRFIADLMLDVGTDTDQPLSFAVFDHGGLVTEIHGPTSSDLARTTAAQPPMTPPDLADTAVFETIAAIFPVRDIVAAVAHYGALGFQVEHYAGDAAYGFAERDGVHLHLAQVSDLDPLKNTSAAYLYVDDARALCAEWFAAGAGGRLHAPTDTDYGLCEGAHIDPDGNLIRFGSALSQG